jgi:tetratricopeptide (TPR) repeat protein
MTKFFMRICFGVCVLLFAPILGRTQVRETDEALAQQVFKQLLTAVPTPQQAHWPPELVIVDKEDVNAYASIGKTNAGIQPVVVCYNGLLQRVIEGNPDRLAYVLGHELAHHILGHTQVPKGDTDFLRATFGRAQELDADREGMTLAVRAGYSFSGGLSAIRKMIDLGLNYSSFEGLSNDHPSWYDRITQLDKEQASIWRSLSSFQNGTYFLLVQNYELAQRAFRQVTKDFPGADEAWANLGYAMLMEYADSLDEADIQRFNVGQIVTGGFYRRSKSLEAHVRGVNEELWWDAVGALREAIRLNPDLSLPRANLGIAYLFRPAGKDPGKAAQYLEEAAKLAQKDSSLDPVSRLAESANLAVAYSAVGDNAKALEELAKVDQSLQSLETRRSRSTASVSNAVAYNRAFLLAQSPDKAEQKRALNDLEGYLRNSDPSGMWWNSAYRKYSDLGKTFGFAPQPASVVHRDPNLHFRPVTDLLISSSRIALGDPMTGEKSRFGGAPTISPVIPRTNLVRYSFDPLGISIIGADEVLAIVLTGANAPALTLHELGVGNQTHQIRVGMSVNDLDGLMQDADYDFRQLIDAGTSYRFYRDVGIAILIRDGLIVEIAISQIPKEATGLI